MNRSILALASLACAAFLAGCATDEEVTGPTRPAGRVGGEAQGVCPPFPLRDEEGNVIDPVKGVYAERPYSPRRTCGAEGCHDYERITEGFHFQQGRGEPVPAAMAERYAWVTAPGNYGGNWCSPAPLYRQLAPQHNTDARTIDMTSFDFVTATCGNCHPGGGPLEFDRSGRRYDAWMLDPASGLTPGGENGLDGDYHKARWSETGVIEADCLLCHMPEYDYAKRNGQLAALNFRWAATVGAGFGAVTGSVKDGGSPVVAYDASRFDEQGNVRLHIAPEPRNETCLNCHFKPDWKKRGAAYSTRTDVHMVAGLRCVDCHAAGSRAADPRIARREEHQFGKGDDPSGWVRNDLDDTVRTCEDCHLSGWHNAPRATHEWLPPLHLESLSCQACHIPSRAVKSALVQASDVYNPAPRITPPPKHIWTFYDQEMTFWNHYGELDLFTGKDEPTNVTRPTLIRYKGKIYPANRVHSAWVGYEEAGKPGLNQLLMKDFFQMWTQHRADPAAKFPELAKITDDNHDGVVEVNRPEEIDALLASTRAYLADTGFPLESRRLVWVSDSRAYYSAAEWRELPRAEHEATAYASVYKFSHDVAPARAALGATGCTDCHRSGSPFFDGPVLEVPFSGADGRPRWVPNYRILGISAFWVKVGAFREQILKPMLYALLAAALFVAGLLVLRRLAFRNHALPAEWLERGCWIVAALGLIGAVLVAVFASDVIEYMTVSRFVLDANHAWIGLGVLAGTIGLLLGYPRPVERFRRIVTVAGRVVWVLVGVTVLAGALMLLQPGGLGTVARLSYTSFDAGLVLLALADAGLLLSDLFHAPGPGATTEQPATRATGE